MNRFIALFLFTILASASHAQSVEHVPFTSPRWEFTGEDHEIVLYKGEEALRLFGTSAWLQDVQFLTGTLEFDIAFSDTRGFQGVRWQVQDQANYEEFYFRSHLSGMPDANQYNPVIGGVAAWQLYHGEGYSAPTRYGNDWMHVRIVLDGTSGELYLDSDEPVLRFNQKGGFGAGGFGVYASRLNVAYFANFTFKSDEPQLRSEPSVFDAPDVGTVMAWDVAGPFSNDQVDSGRSIDGVDLGSLTWQKIAAEEKGITNLARTTLGGEGRHVITRLSIEAELETTKSVLFGYSDRVAVYLNGNLIYRGNNTYITRDYRYLGTIGQFDELILDLEEGRNEVLFLVSEAFGGWGITARIPSLDGITFPDTDVYR